MAGCEPLRKTFRLPATHSAWLSTQPHTSLRLSAFSAVLPFRPFSARGVDPAVVRTAPPARARLAARVPMYPCARARLNTRDPVCSRPAPCVCSVYAANTDAAFWKQCNKENFAKMFSTGSSLQVYNISADTAEILDSNEEDDSEDEGEGRVPSTGATSYSEA